MLSDFRPLISRLVGALIAGLVTWLARKNINIDPDTADALSSLILLLVYSVSHRWLSILTNPTDVAKPDYVETKKL